MAVVGGGPAGLAAARAAAAGGARTIVLERAEHPRYKTCGGGLIGASLSVAEQHISVPARDTISAITFTERGRRAVTRQATKGPILTLVRRDEFDHAWLKAALDAGAEVRQNTQVRGIEQDDDGATVTLGDGTTVTARTVIGADGSAAVSSRVVGVTFAQQDLGLEVELAATDGDRADYRGRVLLDWGAAPGSYGWVFPKGDELTVGVIMRKGRGAETKEYLARLVDQLGLGSRTVLRDSGHLTRCRDDDAPLRRGRVLVVGDAAGLLEPWTREGISFALRSGTWAGEIAAGARSVAELGAYEERVSRELVPEMIAGRRLLGVFSRHRRMVHTAVGTPPGWRAFQAFCRGDLTMVDALRHPAVATLTKALGGRAG